MSNNVILTAKQVPAKNKHNRLLNVSVSGYLRTAQPRASAVGPHAGSPVLFTLFQQLLDASFSELITKTYQKGVAMFQQFCLSELHLMQWFLAKTSTVVPFVTFCFQKGIVHNQCVYQQLPMFIKCMTWAIRMLHYITLHYTTRGQPHSCHRLIIGHQQQNQF